jgi:hypothetical protein
VSSKEEPIRTHSPPLSRTRCRTDREHSPLSAEATLTPQLTTVKKDRAVSPMHACAHSKTVGHDPSAVGLGWRLKGLWRLLQDFSIVQGRLCCIRGGTAGDGALSHPYEDRVSHFTPPSELRSHLSRRYDTSSERQVLDRHRYGHLRGFLNQSQCREDRSSIDRRTDGYGDRLQSIDRVALTCTRQGCIPRVPAVSSFACLDIVPTWRHAASWKRMVD